MTFYVIGYSIYIKQIVMGTQVYIPTDRGIRAIQVCNIVRIEASSNYSKLFFNNDKPLTVAKVLHWFEDKLEEQFFYRIHRTHIVNRQFISTISIDNNVLTLANGEQFKISRRRKENILKLLA
jgi:two-component system, LytTR family, response regulator